MVNNYVFQFFSCLRRPQNRLSRLQNEDYLCTVVSGSSLKITNTVFLFVPLFLVKNIISPLNPPKSPSRRTQTNNRSLLQSCDINILCTNCLIQSFFGNFPIALVARNLNYLQCHSVSKGRTFLVNVCISPILQKNYSYTLFHPPKPLLLRSKLINFFFLRYSRSKKQKIFPWVH